MRHVQHSLQRAAFGLHDEEQERTAVRRGRSLGPVQIEARDVHKTYRIPTERSSRPFARRRYRELRALRGVSFDVRQGEFFGIVGRNGSGKSTLLKVLASIYRADRGRIRMAGRLAPFIELGAGFNPEMTARENVSLNGVMLGLSRREAARRLDSVLDFAELGEFVDLKLKNYSSGMMVRLAFSVMVEADADIMLVDEVLAVGDAAFGQKCMDVFEAKRKAGKTLVLVTHDMAAVQSVCDRAMLIHDGELRYIGDPEEAVLRYYRLNIGGADPDGGTHGDEDPGVELVDAWLENQLGERVENVEQGQPIGFNLVVEAHADLAEPSFNFDLLNVDNVPVFGFGKLWSGSDGAGHPETVTAGKRIRVSATIDNSLVPGRYSVECSISRSRRAGDFAMRSVRLLDFLVMGKDPIPGMVSVQTDLDAILEGGR